jgi:hypothetical protein
MQDKYRKQENHVELNHLIDDAVNSAIRRRNSAFDSADNLLELSTEETQNIIGGSSFSVNKLSTCGMKCPIEF